MLNLIILTSRYVQSSQNLNGERGTFKSDTSESTAFISANFFANNYANETACFGDDKEKQDDEVSSNLSKSSDAMPIISSKSQVPASGITQFNYN